MRCWSALVSLILLSMTGSCGRGGGGPRLGVLIWKPDAPGAWDEALAVFRDEHPGVELLVERGPNNASQLHAMLSQRLRSADTSLHVFLMDVTWTPQFARAGWVLPLNERFPPEDRAAFFPGTIEADTWDGKVWAVPFNTDAGLLYYRKDLLDAQGLEPPETWDRLVEEEERIRAAAGGDALWGYSAQMKQYEGLVCNLLEFVRSNGGRLTEPTDPATIGAIRFVRDRIVGHAAPRGILTYEEQESLDLFRSGGAVFLRTWPYAWARLQESPLAGKVGIAKLPSFTDGGPSVSALGGWRFAIHTRSKRPDLAWAFVRHMTSQAMQRHFALRAGKAPARRALYDDPAVLAANPHFRALRDVFVHATPRPRSPVYPRLSDELQRFLHAAISDPDSDIEGLARETRERLRATLHRVR